MPLSLFLSKMGTTMMFTLLLEDTSVFIMVLSFLAMKGIIVLFAMSLRLVIMIIGKIVGKRMNQSNQNRRESKVFCLLCPGFEHCPKPIIWSGCAHPCAGFETGCFTCGIPPA